MVSIQEIESSVVSKCEIMLAPFLLEIDIPISADINAPQSFAPSPHIATILFLFSFKSFTKLTLSLGCILANIMPFSTKTFVNL